MEAVDVFKRIGELKIVPVVAINDVDAAVALADTLLEGRLPIVEITFRTGAAADVIRKIARERPQMLVGAGTVLTVENLRRAADCGATFGVAPGLNPAIACEALRNSFPFMPGVMTPSDIEGALSLGFKVLKFFPAGASGGVAMLKSVAAPYAHTGAKFVPTGGVNQNNLGDYLGLDIVLAVGGTWIASQDEIASDDWPKIRENCHAAVGLIEQMRGGVGNLASTQSGTPM